MPIEITLEEIQTLAEVVEGTLIEFHEEDPECSDVAQCPEEHFKSYKRQEAKEGQELLKKIDAISLMITRANSDRAIVEAPIKES